MTGGSTGSTGSSNTNTTNTNAPAGAGGSAEGARVPANLPSVERAAPTPTSPPPQIEPVLSQTDTLGRTAEEMAADVISGGLDSLAGVTPDNTPSDESFDALATMRRVRAEHRKQVLEQFSMQDSEKGDYAEIERAAREFYIQKYAKAGIVLSDSDFPRVYIIPKKNSADFRLAMGSGRPVTEHGKFEQDLNIAWVVEGEDSYQNVVNIAHEMFHGIGRKAFELGDQVPLHNRLGLMEQKLGEPTQGSALEEGMAEANAIDFLYESENPLVLSAREQLKAKYAKDTMRSGQHGYEVWLASYQEETHLIRKLQELGGQEMIDLLLQARTDGQAEEQLKTRINQLFGEGMADRIFALYQGNVAGAIDKTIIAMGKSFHKV